MKAVPALGAMIASVFATPGMACSPDVITTFADVVDQADFAFYGRAKVRMKLVAGEYGEERTYAGEVRFTGIQCYTPPRGVSYCPRSLTVPFQVTNDGINCPDWVLWYKPSRDRYFTLWRDKEKKWQLGDVWRSFDRP